MVRKLFLASLIGLLSGALMLPEVTPIVSAAPIAQPGVVPKIDTPTPSIEPVYYRRKYPRRHYGGRHYGRHYGNWGWRRHYGYNNYRRHRYYGYPYYNYGWYGPGWGVGIPLVFALGAYNSGYYGYRGNAHVRWCLNHYRSYDPSSNTFMGYDGYRHRCRGPY